MAMQGSNFWANITERQKDMRLLFFDEQESRRESLGAPGKGGLPTDHWSGITGEQKQNRDTFFAQNSPPDGNKAFWKQPGLSSSDYTADMVFRFTVTAPAVGIIIGEFRSVRGLTTDEWDYEMYREGGDNGTEHMLPKHKKNGRIILEWALRHPDPFVIWCLSMDLGIMLRQPITVTLLGRTGPVAMWIIPQCLIAKIEAPDLDAMTSEVATSKVELIHNGIITVPM